MADTNWQVHAACRGVDPELFFPETPPIVRRAQWWRGASQVAAAKAVCRRCPVREQCLAEALERLPHGIAGGLTEQERRRARAQRERLGRAAGRAGCVLLEAGCLATRRSRAECGVSVRTVERWASRLPDRSARVASGAGSR